MANTSLEHVRNLRRMLEPFNDSALGAAVNSAECEVMAIRHRLLDVDRAPSTDHFNLKGTDASPNSC